jgi:hypothetical protein
LQRFFSTFPEGWPGLGLLILRTLVGVTTATLGASQLTHGYDLNVMTVALIVAAMAGSAAVLAGFLTPAAGALTGTAALLLALGSPPSPLGAGNMDPVVAGFVVADAAALVLLGPGAYSLDARLFGRREVVIPERR